MTNNIITYSITEFEQRMRSILVQVVYSGEFGSITETMDMPTATTRADVDTYAQSRIAIFEGCDAGMLADYAVGNIDYDTLIAGPQLEVTDANS